jgi:hypothetical protein
MSLFPRSRALLVASGAGLLAVAIGTTTVPAADWPQWGRDSAHGAAAAVNAQPLGAILADYVYDPFAPQAQAESGGSLLAHYPVPLIDGPDVYMVTKTGHYVSCTPPGSGTPGPCGSAAWDSQIWNVAKLSWQGGALRTVWIFTSDWKPPPDEGHLNGWEPVFHPALSGADVYVPGAGGSIFRVGKTTGQGTRISPFGAGALDPSIRVAGGLAASTSGQIYYDAIRLSEPAWGVDVAGAWLVAVAPDGTSRTATFASLVPGAPAATDACETSFAASSLPWPPSSDAVPPTAPCGSQRPGLNVVPAVGADGTIFTVSRAHFSDRYGYLVAVNPVTLAPRWSASLRGRLSDGCGVLLPANGQPGGCRDGSAVGVDPATNRPPAGRVSDNGTSSPVVLPDGSVLYGTLTRYNWSRGHLMRFDASGSFLAAYHFGWDITPAIRVHDGGWSVITKDNHYEIGSYCNDSGFCPRESGLYDITSLDAGLVPEWTFTNANTESCTRQPDGSITCVPDHPDGFEWCVNQPAIDAAGIVYANSEDGYLYAIGADGRVIQRIFLRLAIGAAYTPLSIGGDGILYTQNDGHLFAVGNPPRATPVGSPRRPHPRPVERPAAKQ